VYSQARPDAGEAQRLQADILKADDEYQAALWDQRRQLQESHGIANPKHATVTDLQAAIGPQTAVLKYWLGENSSVLFAITHNQFRIFTLPDAHTLGREASDLRRLMISQPQRTARAGLAMHASSLYEKLAQPAASVIRGKSDLVIIPDGILHYLPFEVLSASGPPGTESLSPRNLVEGHSIRYAPSGGVLLALNEVDRTRSAPLQGLLAYGDATYMREPDDRHPAVRSPSLGGSRWSLRPLPDSLREVEGIRAFHEKTGAVVRQGSGATEESLKTDPLLGEYRYLHFAVHGLLDEQRPRLSGIALSLPTSPESVSEDGILHAYEVFHLKMRADVVVLSACETALGAAVTGEGLIGLTQAFLYAGASSVVASLWKVDDRATAEFMIRFHRHLARAAPSAALRLAKLEMIGSGIWADPHYWAAFTLTGYSRPAPLEPVLRNTRGARALAGQQPQGVFSVRKE
jgi:CHAT domain-containing protein